MIRIVATAHTAARMPTIALALRAASTTTMWPRAWNKVINSWKISHVEEPQD